MEKVGIIGSRKYAELPFVEQCVRALVQMRGTDWVMVSGGAVGAQATAEAFAVALGVPLIVFKPVKVAGGREIEDEYGVEEWRIHGDQSQVLQHFQPTFADYQSVLNLRSLMIAERSDWGYCFWNGTSRGTAGEMEMFANLDKPLTMIREKDEIPF